MKQAIIYLLVFISTFSTNLFGQEKVMQIKLSQQEKLSVSNCWGNIHIDGSDSEGLAEVQFTYTDASKKKTELLVASIQDYVDIQVTSNQIKIESRPPKGFSSIDMVIKLPKTFFVSILMEKGGEIEVDGIEGGLEINSRNGSIKARELSNYALLHTVNGSISVAFTAMNSDKASSFVSLNGEVELTLPEGLSRDLRLSSAKNGYLRSEFALDTDMRVYDSDVKIRPTMYQKEAFQVKSRIGKGGTLLHVSTGNGPIHLLKY